MSPHEAVAILRQRFAERLPHEERLAREIRAVVPRVAEVLAREFGVRRVVLFGSLARGLAHPDSDIDLAVEGLPPAATLRAMTRCDDVAGRHVDLVPLEEARPEVRAIIARDGETILDG
jgi:uncharacterized protein